MTFPLPPPETPAERANRWHAMAAHLRARAAMRLAEGATEAAHRLELDARSAEGFARVRVPKGTQGTQGELGW